MRSRVSQISRVDDIEVKIAGIDVLNKTLGPVLAFRFLTLFHREPTDYVEISRRLYEGQSIDEIFERAKSLWGSTALNRGKT